MRKIPGKFLNEDMENPFEECIRCGTEVRTSGEDYLIEKAVRHFPELQASEIMFEYAICASCALKTREKLSKESRKNIEDYLNREEVQLRGREISLLGLEKGGDATERCMLTGRSIHDITEYQLFACCHGGQLSHHSQAFMISGEGLEILAGLLSDETKDELDRFRDIHFGLPPEWEGRIYSRNLLLL